MLKLRNKKFIS